MTALAAPLSMQFALDPLLPSGICAPAVNLQTLQLGMSWFTEKPGGLERYHSELLAHLPDAGVDVRGLVMGSARVSRESDGAVLPAAATVKTVRQRVPEVLVMIAGKGWLAAELQQRIQSAGLQHNVRLLGFLPDNDLPLAYRAADLTVVPTVSPALILSGRQPARKSGRSARKRSSRQCWRGAR